MKEMIEDFTFPHPGNAEGKVRRPKLSSQLAVSARLAELTIFSASWLHGTNETPL